jgi:hypothetical protein
MALGIGLISCFEGLLPSLADAMSDLSRKVADIHNAFVLVEPDDGWRELL